MHRETIPAPNHIEQTYQDVCDKNKRILKVIKIKKLSAVGNLWGA